MDDLALLRAYAERQAEDAFATLVGRYSALVYSAALDAQSLEPPRLYSSAIQARRLKALGAKMPRKPAASDFGIRV